MLLSERGIPVISNQRAFSLSQGLWLGTIDKGKGRECKATVTIREATSPEFSLELDCASSETENEWLIRSSTTPSRPKLFDDDDEEDYEESFSNSSGFSNDSYSCPSTSPPSSYLRKSFTPTSTLKDPLLFPASPLLESEDPDECDDEDTFSLDLTSSSSPPSPRSLFPRLNLRKRVSTSTSALTASLLALARLPNLSLSTAATQSFIASSAFASSVLDEGIRQDPIDYFPSSREVERQWIGTRGSMRGAGGSIIATTSSNEKWFEKSIPVVDELESGTTIVHLQTFAPPPATLSMGVGMKGSKKVESVDIVVSPSPVARIISNPRHLHMLALEMEMIAVGKISSPLRPRAFILRYDSKTGRVETGMVARSCASALRWEITVEA